MIVLGLFNYFMFNVKNLNVVKLLSSLLYKSDALISFIIFRIAKLGAVV